MYRQLIKDYQDILEIQKKKLKHEEKDDGEDGMTKTRYKHNEEWNGEI